MDGAEKVTLSTVWYGDRLESEANLPTDRLFTGQRYDDTGLYYYGARYYDPEIGRFISPDTMGPDPYNPQSRNKYSYCFNNPLKYIDPSGSWPEWLDDAVSWVGEKVEVVVEAATEFVTENIDAIQTGLDIAGMIPVVGEVFDAINGGIYAARGDWANASMSFASCVPVVGTAVGVAALGVKAVIKGADAVKSIVKATDTIGDAVKLVDKANDATKLNRPYIRKATREAVESIAAKQGNNFIDPNTLQPITGKYHLGHKYGYEFSKYRSWAEKQGMTQARFNDIMNNPSIYQIESPISNMSHMYEAPWYLFYGGN